MGLIGDFLGHFANSIGHPESGDHSYLQLIQRKPDEEPSSYRLTREQVDNALGFTERLAELGCDMDGLMEKGEPKPEPVLRVRPNY
jgi:hypothetical protein